MTKEQKQKLKERRKLTKEIVAAARYRNGEDLEYQIIDKDISNQGVIVNSVMDALWTGIDNEIDPVKVIHSAVLRLTFQMPSDELHDKMKILLRILDAEYDDKI